MNEVDEKYLKIEEYYSDGHSGLIWKAKDGVKITHMESGISVSCSSERSQIKNRVIAMQELHKRLAEKYGYTEKKGYKPKFKKGKKIETMAEFDFALEFDKCIYFFNKPLHFGFIQNWQYVLIKRYVKQGYLFKAVRVK